jgi:hypothetical protein
MPIDPLDFSSFEQQALQQREPGPILRFFIEARENRFKSMEAGRPIYDNVEMISIINPGSKDEFIKEVDDSARQRFGRQYEHWKRTQEQPAEGTPLEMVPFLNPGQVKELRAINIPTLEHLAHLTDTAVQKIGMGGVELVRKAQAYLKAAGDNSVVTKLVAENQRLKSEVDALKAQIAQVNQRYESVLAGASQPTVEIPANLDAMIEAAIARKLNGAQR